MKQSSVYSIFLIVISFLFLISCGTEKENSNQNNSNTCRSTHKILSFTTQSLEINSQNKPYFFTIDFVYEKKDSILYYGYSASTSSLEVVDLNQKRYTYTIPIAKTGPHKIANLSDFYVQSPDSIFIHTGFLKRLYLINRRGEILSKWTIDEKLPDGTSSDGGYFLSVLPSAGVRFYYVSLHQSMLFRCEYLFFKNPFDKKFYQKPILVEYSLMDSTFHNLQGTYPKEYQSHTHSSYDKQFPFVISQEGSVFVGFTKSHQIHQYNQGQERKHCVKSQFTKDKFVFLPVQSKPEKYQEDYSLNAQYLGLFYDKRKDLLYRIVKHAQPPKNAEGLLNKYQNASFSILVIDSQGKVLGETKPFPNNLYNFANIYPTSKGILISKESKYNELNKEDFLEFDWIQIDL